MNESQQQYSAHTFSQPRPSPLRPSSSFPSPAVLFRLPASGRPPPATASCFHHSSLLNLSQVKEWSTPSSNAFLKTSIIIYLVVWFLALTPSATDSKVLAFGCEKSQHQKKKTPVK